MTEYFNEGTPHLSMAGIPSPFDHEPIPYTNPYKDLPELILPTEKTKRNSNYTKPKKRRKK